MGTYIIHDTYTNLYKIGSTTNIKRRLSTLGTANINLQLLLYVDINIEKLLHKIYKDCKICKEWYKLKSDEIENIKEFIFEYMINNS